MSIGFGVDLVTRSPFAFWMYTGAVASFGNAAGPFWPGST